MTRVLLTVLALVISTAAAQSARASTVTLVGSSFDVVYDPSQLGLFGNPQLSGDALIFTPNAFSDQSLNGVGTQTVSSIASGIQLVAHPGWSFGSLSLNAVGDYLMQGQGTSVGVSGTFTATDDAKPLTQTTANLVVPTSLTIVDGASHNWVGSASITDSTPTVTPGHNPWVSQAGTIDVQLDNVLTATTTQLNSQAFIQEKFGVVRLLIDPMPVPLPASFGLLLAGLVGLGSLRRRRAA